MALDIVANNSFRILGVFGNSSKKEILSNKSKFNAYLRVNQPVPAQPLDLANLLPPIIRNIETINNAESELSVSKGRLVQCMFWFVNTDFDDLVGMDCLARGDIDAAIKIWKSKGSIGSLQNIMMGHLIANRYREAVILAHNMLSVHFEDWRQLFSLLPDVSAQEVAHLFLDSLYSEIPDEITSMNWTGMPKEWEHYVKMKTAMPLMDGISSMIELCKQSHRDNPDERYKDGFTLLEKAQPLLKKLESLLKSEDIMLQSIEDKVYSEALDCSITSYNVVFDKLYAGNENSFREIAPRCNELVNMIDLGFVSPTLANRINENRKTINEKCLDVEKTIERALNIMITCPECGNESSSIKRYTMIRWVLFLLAAIQVQRVTYTCCPKCMRKHILLHGFTYNIITGNFFWLLVVLPWSIVLLIMSYTKGHSSSVLSIINKN